MHMLASAIVALTSMLSPVLAGENLQISPTEVDRRLVAELPLNSASGSILRDRLQSVLFDERDADKMDSTRINRAKILAHGLLNREFSLPEHQRQKSYIESAYQALLLTAWSDSSFGGGMLLDVLRGYVKHGTHNPHIIYAHGPILLVERSEFYAEAEAIARQGLEQAGAYVHVRRSSESTEEHAKRKAHLYSQIHDALGWALTHQSRMEEAIESYKTALDLDSRNRMAWYHYAATMERLDDLSSAESLYSRSLSIPMPGETPAEAALQGLYEKQKGTMEGYRDYRVALAKTHRERRREEILQDRIEQPEAGIPFSLVSLDGNTVSLSENTGKVIVVNFWGIWCSWCKLELPEFQRLHEQYADDQDVLILSINNDKDADEVRDWMSDRGFDFTALIDDGYVKQDAGIHSFPTTWFINRAGRVAYIQKGYTPSLLEEFSWRIEALR